MDEDIIDKAKIDFGVEDYQQVICLLKSLKTDDVMADSESDLRNIRLAVLKLAKGNIANLIHYITSAKKDFRDVIHWSAEE